MLAIATQLFDFIYTLVCNPPYSKIKHKNNVLIIIIKKETKNDLFLLTQQIWVTIMVPNGLQV